MSDDYGVDLSDLLIRTQIHIIQRLHQGENPYPRLVGWAIAALVREGREKDALMQMLGDRPLVRQWWLLRQMLSVKAIQTLEEKLASYGTQKNKD